MYEKLIKSMLWSFSRLSCYEECPYSFYLQYIERDPDRDKDDNYYAENGLICHEIIADALNGKISAEDAAPEYAERYENINSFVSENIMNSTFDKCYSYFDNLKPLDEKYEILGVEKRLFFNVGEYKFMGIADLILRDKETNKVILVDHKSGGHMLKANGEPLKNMSDSFASYSRQMYLYCKGINDVMGLKVDTIVWNHFKDDGRLTVIPFSQESYEETLRYVLDVIDRASKDEEFAPRRSYMRCKSLCAYRGSCEYLTEEDEESEDEP